LAPQSNEIYQFTRNIERYIVVGLDQVEHFEGEAGFSVQRPFLAQKPIAMGSLAKFEAVPVQHPLYVRAASHKHTACDQVSDRVDSGSGLRLEVLLLQDPFVCHFLFWPMSALSIRREETRSMAAVGRWLKLREI
jgi:hypothetical protein